MLRRIMCLNVLLFAAALGASAQEIPRTEVFLGYSFFRVDIGTEHASMSGVNVEVALNANRWLGIVGDFSAHFGKPMNTNFNVENLLFGPQITFRGHRTVHPFAHALFGGARVGAKSFNTSPPTVSSDVAFAWALGGGVNVAVNDWMDARVVQADYLGTRHFGQTQTNARLSFGFVFHFGKK